MNENLMDERRLALRQEFGDYLDPNNQQRNEFFKHVNNNRCQKCGETTNLLNGVSLNCSFYDRMREDSLGSEFYKQVIDLTVIDKRFKNDEFLISHSISSIVLCDDCHKDLKKWLNIHVHNPEI
jgi:hypothetical protein